VGGQATVNTLFANVGLILGVTPRVTPDGLIVMEVDAENSSSATLCPSGRTAGAANRLLARADHGFGP
jgi:type II secretory pathway component GspD/PulD (secretin)